MQGVLLAAFLGAAWACLVSAARTNCFKRPRPQMLNLFPKVHSTPFSPPNVVHLELNNDPQDALPLSNDLESKESLAILKTVLIIPEQSDEQHSGDQPNQNTSSSSSMLPVDESGVPGHALLLQSDSRVWEHQKTRFSPQSPAAMGTKRDPHSLETKHDQRIVTELKSKRTKRGASDAPANIRQASGKDRGRKNLLATTVLNASVERVAAVWEAVPQPLPLNQSVDHLNMYHTRSYGLHTLSDGMIGVTPDFRPANSSRRRQLKNPFYPLTEYSYGAYAVICLAVVIFFVGILGNIAIMCIVCHNYYMRSISNSLLANLAFWDFLVIFFCLPLVIFHEITKKWLLGDFSCKIIPYIEVASLGVTTFTLCALCIDRFRAATNVQMYYEMIENCTSTAAKLAVIWVGALLLALPEVVLRQLIKEDTIPSTGSLAEQCVVKISPELPDTIYVLALTYDGARLWWYFGCYFCLPTLFTIGSSLVTARKIRQAEKACTRGNKRQMQLESQMNCTVVALTILYGFCIIPENICNIVAAYMATGVSKQTMDLLYLISQFLLFFKSCVTPVLLFCLCKPFSQAFMECCCCCCEECAQKSSTMTSDDNDNEFTTELELSPFSTIHREMSTFTSVGTHC